MTAITWQVFAAGTGACVGSFLNVVIWRLPRGENLSKPRSRCPGCGTMIRWFDNIPILSWILLRARCRKCKAHISARYPLVEALTAALFLLAAIRNGPPAGMAVAAVQALLLAALVAVTFIDWDHRIIPDRITKPGIAIALLLALLVPDLHSRTFLAEVSNRHLAALLEALAGAIVGGGIILLVRWIGTRILKKEAMGLGDAKLLAMIGAFTSPASVMYTLLIGSVGGAVLGAFYVLARTRRPAAVDGAILRDGSPEIAFTRARVSAEQLWIVAPSALPSGEKVRVRLRLSADSLWEEKDAVLALKGAVVSSASHRGGAIIAVRLDSPATHDADALFTFALIRRYIPFGPFLAFGGACMVVYGVEVTRFFSETWPLWVRGKI